MSVPDRIGPYRVLGAVGKGGMGAVYVGTLGDAERRVALKTVRVTQAALVLAIRREIRALSRLEHPGIVRIVDDGVDAGMPWYAMELLEGITLRDHMRQTYRDSPNLPSSAAPTERLDTTRRATPAGAVAPGPEVEVELGAAELGEILTIAARLCVPLAYLHGEGLVHRDLKPENVLLGEGHPVIVDFGLASSFAGLEGRDELQLGGEVSGTVAYIAPEQASGDLVDARADIYALGCILYELLTGRPPFASADPVAALTARLMGLPPPPGSVARGVPAAVDALVMKLLATAPAERIGYAEDVERELVRLGAEAPATVAPLPRAYLYRAATVGRGGTIGLLERYVARLARGKGGIVFLGGESGAGKTRVAVELGTRAVRDGRSVLTAACPDPRGRGSALLSAFRPVLDAIADRCRERGAGETSRLLGSRRALLARFAPSIAELPGTSADQLDEPVHGRMQLFAALLDTLKAIATRPTVLVVDDGHWADELSAGFIESLLDGGELDNVPLLLLVTYRTAETASSVVALAARGDATTLELARLDDRAVHRMVGEVLAVANPPSSLAEHLYGLSQGNPLFVAEYLRAAMDGGFLKRTSDGRWTLEEPTSETALEQLRMPATIRGLVTRHIDGLGRSARHLLSLAAIVGREAATDILQAAYREGDALEPMHELVRRQAIESAGGSVRFVHDQLREVVLERIPTEEVAGLHRAVAEALEGAGASRGDEMGRLGHHWDVAGEPDRARSCYLAGARHAASAFAYGEAERLYRRHLDLAPEATPESIQARLELGANVCHRNGDVATAEVELRRALDDARALGERGHEAAILRRLALVHLETGRIEQAAELLERTIAIAREVGDRRLEGLTLANRALLLRDRGAMNEARADCEHALAIHRAMGNRRAAGVALGNLANLHFAQGRLDEARAAYEQELALHRELRDRWSEGIVLGNLATVMFQQGDTVGARALYDETIAIHGEVGNRLAEGRTLVNMGALEMDRLRLEEALALLDRSLAIHRKLGNRRDEASVLTNLAIIATQRGRMDEARQLHEQALAISRALENRRLEGIVLGNLALRSLLAGEPIGEAEGLAQESEALLRGVDSIEHAKLLCTRGHIALADDGDPNAYLRCAMELARDAGTDTSIGTLGRIAALDRARDARAAGVPLVCGHRADDLTTDQLRWLRAHRPDLIPPAIEILDE